jgi:hypothetical protein
LIQFPKTENTFSQLTRSGVRIALAETGLMARAAPARNQSWNDFEPARFPTAQTF